MATITEEVQEIRGGFAKGIEASAVDMILENLQKFQYQFPIKSTIREIASNGVDAIVDKRSALDIIINHAPISKYYEEKQGELFKDSKFTPSYYNPRWLSNDDVVYITYQEGSGTEKDQLVIEDFGVGLGGYRLEKFFRLGFSTKRLSKQPLGKFGIGAKSPLSVGVDFYTVESRYNGQKFRFNVYSNRVESIIPRFNMDTGTENPFVVFTSEHDYKVHYEETDEMNGVTLIIAAKKHHKQQYIDAVKSQLLYFNDIQLRVVQGGHVTNIPYKATVFYEDEHIILSDNSMWSKPHLLLNKVNYGYINFDELELEQKSGNIGLKVDPAEVDINPSRESVIWSEKTKATILEKYNLVVDIATKMVQKELSENDFMRWLRTCFQISSRTWGNTNSIVHRLAGIINIGEVKPFFPGHEEIRFHPNALLKGLSLRSYSFKSMRRSSDNNDKYKVEREEIWNLSVCNHLPMVLIDSATSVRKDKYLLKMVYTSGFVGIRLPVWMDEDWEYSSGTLDKLDISGRTELEILKKKVGTIWELLEASAETISYHDVEVPDSFVCSDEDEEEVVTEEDREVEKVAAQTAEERRKVEGKTVYHTMRRSSYYSPTIGYQAGRTYPDFTWDKAEIRIMDINQWTDRETFYGNDADIDSLKFAGMLSGRLKGEVDHLSIDIRDRKDIRFIKVAQANNKLYRDFKHINRFFLSIKNNVISMSNVLVRWNTARMMLVEMDKLSFLFNFSAFNPQKHQQYIELLNYMDDNYSEVYRNTVSNSNTAYTGLVAHLEKVQNFQLFIETEPTAEQIAAMAKEVFGNPSIADGVALDMPVWKKFKGLVEYADAVGPMLNEMPVLTGLDLEDKYVPGITHRTDLNLCAEVEQAIQAFLEWKGVVLDTNMITNKPTHDYANS